MGTSSFHPGLTLVVLFLVLLAGEHSALAWGPATHLDFGLQVLKELLLLAPPVAALIRRFPLDFLYGTLAPDITVGKNLSPYALHCHNWRVARSVLELAERDHLRAFAWGYLSHLAADIVAHNYFVPFKMVQHFHRRRAAHAYWEIRFDTWVGEETWQVARTLSTRAFREHDSHLRNIIVGPLFSFPVNKQIFNSLMLANRLLRRRQAVRAVQRNASLVLDAGEVEECRRLSLERMRALLRDGLDAEILQVDPTGHRNLLIARQLHRDLYQWQRQEQLIDRRLVERIYRPLFRASLDARLELPAATELLQALEQGPEILAGAGRGQAARRPGPRSWMLLMARAKRRWRKPSASRRQKAWRQLMPRGLFEKVSRRRRRKRKR
ncbi:MAG: hypothetical protein DRI34_04840 [Deltaproteobacteria bacterium]|nr:MAG: hypothetical protein DRI34_04840 [Deltaproteobacteria bacterium]